MFNYNVEELNNINGLEVRRTILKPFFPYSRTRGHRHKFNEPEYLWVESGFGVLVIYTDRLIHVPLVEHHVYRIFGFHAVVNNSGEELRFVTIGKPAQRIYEQLEEGWFGTACLMFSPTDDYSWLTDDPLYIPIIHTLTGFKEYAIRKICGA